MPEILTKPVVFLDRDGVINRNYGNYVTRWSEFAFLPGSLEAIRQLTNNGFKIIIITNQSLINRNIIPLKTLASIHQLLIATVRAYGGDIGDIFFCPHHPGEGCECRKPKPGMIFQAKNKYGIHLSNAWMIGDSVTDLECAQNARIGKFILVRTGKGSETEKILESKPFKPNYIADNLMDAVENISPI